MKNTLIIIALSASLLGAGCSNTLTLPAPEQSTSNPLGLSTLTETQGTAVSEKDRDANFEKAVACSKYKDQAKKYVEGKNWYVPETGVSVYNRLEQIFYSPRTNSCLIEYEEKLMKGGTLLDTGGTFYLEDYLTTQMHENMLYELKDRFKIKGEWDKLVATYK